MNKQEVVVFESEDGEKIEFYVEEETRINGTAYLLVSDSDDEEEATAYILKDLSEDGEEEARYVIVEDETEMDAVARVFAEMLEDTDIF